MQKLRDSENVVSNVPDFLIKVNNNNLVFSGYRMTNKRYITWNMIWIHQPGLAR